MTTSELVLLIVHLAATLAMVGLIWFVQVVHYPLFGAVGADEFTVYERDHQRRTAWVVGPFMAVEGTAALAVVVWPMGQLGRGLPLAGLVLLAVIHASTVFLQVPAHRHLSSGYDQAVVTRLVATNWIRTVSWSARGAMAAAMLVVAA